MGSSDGGQDSSHWEWRIRKLHDEWRDLGKRVGCGCVGHAGAGLQTGEQKHGHPRARANGANLDILLLKQEMKDSVLQDPTSFFQCMLIEYLSHDVLSIVPRAENQDGSDPPPPITVRHEGGICSSRFCVSVDGEVVTKGTEPGLARSRGVGAPTSDELSPGEWFIWGGSEQCVHPDAMAGGWGH